MLPNKQFTEIVHLIKQSRFRALKAVNAELISLYWNLGAYLHFKIEGSVWGSSVVEELASYLQQGLIQQMKKFMIELGSDFLFVGQEFKLQVRNSDFFIDLLFYHRGLQCLVAFELKASKFKPEHIGQLNFYLEALDRDVKKAHENPKIGILLCKDKDAEVVEYALNRRMSPTLVSEYQMQVPSKKLLQKKLHKLFENELLS